MRRNEIKEKIKQAAIIEMPDVLSRINLENIKIEPKEKKRFNFNFGKVLKFSVMTIALVFTSFFVYNNFFSPINNSNTPLESDMEVLGFQTITGAVILDQSNLVELSYEETNEAINLSTSTTESLNIDDYISDINPFIHLMETILNNDSTISYEEFTSDNEDYAYAFQYTSSDLAKNELTYKVYYNQNDESVNGKIMFSDKEYGFSKTEKRVKISVDEDNYILVDDDSNIDQQKFKYQLYQSGDKVLENNMEIYRVQKNIQVRTRIQKNGLSMNLYIQRTYLNNLDELEVEYEIEESQKSINGQFKVNLEFDQQVNGYKYRYIMPNNSSVNQPRGPFSSTRDNNSPRFGVII